MDMQQIPYPQAALALGFPADLLRHLVAAGVIAGDKSMCDLDEAAQIAARLRAVQEPVQGKPILVSEAVNRYGFGTRSIYKWISKGWVKILQQDPVVLIDEGDIALANVLASLVGHIPRRAIFPAKPRSGRPKKHLAPSSVS